MESRGKSMPDLDPNIYGGDPVQTAEEESRRVLGNPDPQLDVFGENDERARTQGNGTKQG